MTRHSRKPLWRKWPFLLLMTGVVAWFGLLAGAAYPAWRAAQRKAAEVESLESRIDHLNRWTVAGVWIEKDVRERGAEVRAEFDRLFPPAHDRALLFLQLARVADESGVTGLDLATIASGDKDAQDRAMPATDADMRTDPAMDGVGAEPSQLDLQPYRVKARFVADLRDAAGFLRAVDAMDRAITVHRFTAHPATTGIEVELELDVYAHATI